MEKEEEKNYITLNCLSWNSTDEVKMIMEKNLYGDDSNFDYYANEIYKNKNSVKEILSHPIPISELEQIISDCKKIGSNYISIDYHEDHQEYEINGYEVHISTKEEIKEYEDEYNNFKSRKLIEINDKIAKLTAEKEFLTNESVN